MAKVLPDPVIVVPGLIATYLEDRYPVAPELVWAVINKNYDRAMLHPDDPGLRYELREPARVVPGQIYEVAYKELTEELRFNLSPRADQPVPVYPFPYDWRLPIEITEQALGLFVQEVIARTKLLRHYDKDGYADDPAVTLIGHSMGGLIIAGYLERTGKQAPVRKVVTMASPYRGSIEPIVKIATGIGNFGEEQGNSREREAARLTPSLYQLLPSFPEAVMGEHGPLDIYDPATWQSSIVDTLTSFIRLHGLDPAAPKEKAAKLFKRLLDDARVHRARIDGLKLASTPLKPDDWLCLVGIGARTRVQMKIETQRGRNAFVVNSDLRIGASAPNSNLAAAGTDERTGDGTVPFLGAVPAFLPREKLVCTVPKDFGFWELQDKTFAALAGFHGILPNMNMLIRMVVRFLTGASDPHGNTWGRRAPGVAAGAWAPPLKLDEQDPITVEQAA